MTYLMIIIKIFLLHGVLYVQGVPITYDKITHTLHTSIKLVTTLRWSEHMAETCSCV